MPRIVGLTGGIATGKSTVSSLWSSEGATIVDADKIAREVVEPGRPAYLLIRRHFGRDILHADGRLNRAALGRIVFSDARQRAALNRRIHPFIILSMIRQVITAAVFHWRRVIVLDAPLLFESGTLVPLCSRIVVVSAPLNVQLQRLKRRDTALSDQDAQQRIDSQMPLHLKEQRAHHVIDNSGTEEQLRKQALDILKLVQPSPISETAFRAIVCGVAFKLVSVAISALR